MKSDYFDFGKWIFQIRHQIRYQLSSATSWTLCDQLAAISWACPDFSSKKFINLFLQFCKLQLSLDNLLKYFGIYIQYSVTIFSNQQNAPINFLFVTFLKNFRMDCFIYIKRNLNIGTIDFLENIIDLFPS